ncbi:polymorphic toxin-type HINT domain-containing protein [Kitasatospora sp. NPDC017646]|uniref:polymorphic toxin-type HINT domain-containing protein n=1 Tax=Kitasatospora sp. NPDC017646 TaxID=3364024 RepID=UPI0037990DD0
MKRLASELYDGFKTWRAESKAAREAEQIAGSCLTGGKHSFKPDTPVLLADGTTKPIKDVKPGDNVQSTDPQTDTTTAEPVTATIVTPDDRQFTDLTLGSSSKPSDTITSTQHHPYWDETTQRWTNAADVQVGDQLRAADGALLTVEATRNYETQPQEARDLSVAVLHTYYVLAGATPVLVHNCGEADPYSLKRTEALSGNASKRNVDNLAASMKENGWQGDPIKVAKSGDDLFVLDGHHRVAAAKRAGINVPYRIASEEELLAQYPGGIDEVASAWAEVGPDKLVNRYKKPGFR